MVNAVTMPRIWRRLSLTPAAFLQRPRIASRGAGSSSTEQEEEMVGALRDVTHAEPEEAAPL